MTTLQTGLLTLGASGACAYGILYLQKPPSWPRTISKVLLAACLALAARFGDAPGLLGVGLALCAVGDALLSRDPARWLSPGIVVFLLAHLVLTALFIEIGDSHRLLAEPLRAVGVVVAAVWCGGLLARLWPSLGAMKAPAAAYTVALLATVVAALTLPFGFALAILGAVLFLASDSILSVRIFRHANAPSLLWDQAVWILYAAAIGLIAWPFLHG